MQRIELINRSLLAALVCLICTAAGCDKPTTDAPGSKKQPSVSHQVTATSYPLSYFTQRLVDDSIKVLTFAPEAGSTDSWRPTRDQIFSMQQSDIIFVNGSAAPFATWLPHVTLPDSKICQTANDGLEIADMIAVKDIRIVHSHGPEGEHSHPTMVAYTWLDPEMAAKQVAVMAERLSSTYPALKPIIEASQKKLAHELNQLSSQISDCRGGVDASPIVLTRTPDLKFLTRAAGLNDVHLNWGEFPTAAEAKSQLEAKLSSLSPRPTFMLFTSEPPPEVRATVETFNLTIIVFNLMAFSPPEGDYCSVMRGNLDRLKKNLRPPTKADGSQKH